MSDNKHTAEPWYLMPKAMMNIKAMRDSGVDSVVANCGGYTSNVDDSHDENHANAKRIVECVNGCAGLSVEEIKEAVRSFKYLKEIQS